MSKWNGQQLEHIADILMAAAHADGDVQGVEGSTVRQVVTELAGSKLPASLDARLKGFKHESFDLAKAGAALGLTESAQRRELLQLVARVTESDEVHDLDESDYIVKVAKAVGASRDEYAGLTVSLEDAGPPPLPTK